MKRISLIYLLINLNCVANDLKPTIIVSAERSLIDSRIDIAVSNLTPQQLVTITATCQDEYNNDWQGEAKFCADENGVINITNQAPMSGTYTGIDGMGLFWSMQPLNPRAPRFKLFGTCQNVCLRALIDDQIITEKTIERVFRSDSIIRQEIREQGVVGTLFSHKDKQAPGVIEIGGSEGGILERSPQILASHGYTVLALGYFAEEGLPPQLENIELEYFENAVNYLKHHPSVSDDKITLIGTSRGGELALLLAAVNPQLLNAIVAYVPCNVDLGGDHAPCWLYKGKPILNSLTGCFLFDASYGRTSFDKPWIGTDWFLRFMQKYPDEHAAAEIPVEQITCPTLIISGEDDAMWPSALYSKKMIERLDKKGNPNKDWTWLNFKDAGHALHRAYIPKIDRPSYHPILKYWFKMGGTTEGDAYASRKSQEAVMEFLSRINQK